MAKRCLLYRIESQPIFVFFLLLRPILELEVLHVWWKLQQLFFIVDSL
jgi:hypothetical protein